MDEFDAVQRLRLKLDAVASESLSGTVYFEIGQQRWGYAGTNYSNRSGGALGADDTGAIKIKNAYLDWMVPQTDLKIRMGIQGIALPSFAGGGNVFNDDVAGITASYKFNDNVSLTAVWARPYNDNFSGGTYRWNGVTHNIPASYMDNVDAFALLIPLTFDGVKITPWAMYAAIGPNAFKTNSDSNANPFDNIGNLNAGRNDTRAGMVPAFWSHKDGNTTLKRLTSYGDAWWLGLTGEVTAFNPFRIAWDLNYGSVKYDDSMLNRHGWFGALLFEYKLDWGIPGLYGWYSSGDDGDPSNGSERMPFVGQNSAKMEFSQFAFHGSRGLTDRDSLIGKTMVGTWGIGARLKDMSFVESLKHTVYVNYIGGTNNTRMVRYHHDTTNPSLGINNANIGGTGRENMYLTTNDHVWDIGIANTYQMYENLIAYLDISYMFAGFDQSNRVWGEYNFNGTANTKRKGSDQIRDPWNINVGFYYSF